MVELILSAYDLDGVVLDANEENPGAYVHFNLDNDNSSNNSVGAPKHPGGDYLETTVSVSGENDLKVLKMDLKPMLDSGTIVLTIPSCAKVWNSAAKGDVNNLVLGSGSKSWDLSDPCDRSAFLALGSGVYVEGINNGSGNITLEYVGTGGFSVSDIIKYTFIAADCGEQARTDNGQRGRFEGAFTGLVRCEWSITDNSTIPNMNYNCIAFTVDDYTHWWNPIYTIPGTNVRGIDDEYGNPKNGSLENSDLDNFYYSLKGYSPTAIDANDAQVMYYSGYHGAKKRGCGCGSGKWIMFESKCGGWERIEHIWDQLNGSSYGTPTRFYK